MKALFTILKGAAMGIAEVIPGVSGGTIAFLTGIYERLLNCIKSFSPKLISIFKKDGLKGVWQAIDGNFLIFLFVGMGLGVVTGVLGVTYLLENYPVPLWAFFFGLIIASAIYIGRQIPKWRAVEIIGLIVGTAIAYTITILPVGQGSDSLVFIFFCGAIAISALILPGISGSFILLLMGMYQVIIPTVKTALKTFESEALLVLVVFGAGCILGLATFSRVLSWTFKKFRNPTFAVLTGFMIGSLNKIWPWRHNVKGLDEDGNMVTDPTLMDKVIESVNVSPMSYNGDNYLVLAIVAAVVGFGIVFAFEFFTKNDNKETEAVEH
ncbi:MAG: DUF368 domain-containing protein [Saprospiraceae bacterium]|nr:DUF368 domain-containing protein [Saprospiraceae bacterium]